MVACLAEHGWRACELHDTHGRYLAQSPDPFAAGQRFRAYAADQGMAFPQGHFISTTDNPHDPWFDIAPVRDRAFAKAMDEMRRWVDLFAGLGVRAGMLHVGGSDLESEGWSREMMLDRRVEAIRIIADHARGGPTAICVENLAFSGSSVRTLDEIQALLGAVDRENVAICLDTGHAHMGAAAGDGSVDIPAFIRGAGSRLLALHVNDNLGGDDIHLLPYGGGSIAWEPVLGALRQIGYAGVFNLEITGENQCPAPVRLAKLEYAFALACWMIGQCTGSG